MQKHWRIVQGNKVLGTDGKVLVKLPQLLYHTNRQTWRRLFDRVGHFCQLQSRGFATGEGKIELDRLSQHNTA